MDRFGRFDLYFEGFMAHSQGKSHKIMLLRSVVATSYLYLK